MIWKVNKDIFTRPSNITAKVIADSISENGDRITTMEIEYPRFITCELNTHSMLCVNSSSSRAIPIDKYIEQIESNMAVPLYWGSKKTGMVAGEEIDNIVEIHAHLGGDWCGGDLKENSWRVGFDGAKILAQSFNESGYHKQIPNRLLEPFVMMKTVVTATEWDNFFHLRLHPNAQPEFIRLAYEMYKARENSTPELLKNGEYHTPYVKHSRDALGNILYHIKDFPISQNNETVVLPTLSLEDAIKTSCACACQVSYRKNDNSQEKVDKVYDMLINDDILHGSAFAHVATPIDYENILTGSGYDYDSALDWLCDNVSGISHINKSGDWWSAQYKGWIQYRKTLPNENCTSFNFEERMKMFT